MSHDDPLEEFRGPGRFHAKGPSARHEAAIPKLPTTGMRQAICDQLGDDPGPLRFVSDAYRIDDEAKAVTLFEVIVTHSITPAKLKKFASLAAWLDARGWALRLELGDFTGSWTEGDISTGRPMEAAVFAAFAAATADGPFARIP